MFSDKNISITLAIIAIILAIISILLATATNASLLNYILADNLHNTLEKQKWKSSGYHEITSYNAVPGECDSEPDIGAHGRVAVNGKPTGNWFACNWLEKGTKIKIPAISGETVWECRDKTSRKVGWRIDLLYPVGKKLKNQPRHEEIYIYEKRK